MSLRGVRGFTRLRSLTINKLSDLDIEKLLNHVKISALVSFSINSCETTSIKTSALLSSIIAQPTVQKLCLKNSKYLMEHLSWPVQCRLEYLTIEVCTFRQYILFLHQLSNLQTFVMDDCKMDETSDKTVFFSSDHPPSLSSLTINKCFLSMEDLELLLSRTPVLFHLKLVSLERTFDAMLDGHNWEHVIYAKLTQLNKFEFFCSYINKINADIGSLDSLMVSFQTPFWIEVKQWFVTIDYAFISETLRLYTTPLSVADSSNSIRCEISTKNGTYRLTGPSMHKTEVVNEDNVCIRCTRYNNKEFR